ncbi:MAG: hypothetical protein E7K32_11400, partial [Bacteroides stercoris]|nr:hypothetical protein [Bacteroides stercoris]
WRFLLRCTLFCHSVATFLTSVSSYEGGCGFEVYMNTRQKYHKLIDKTNKLWIKTNLYTDKLLFK